MGTANFNLMEELDGDDVRIKNAQGKPASRDIVQFVPMREFTNKGFHALAREVSGGWLWLAGLEVVPRAPLVPENDTYSGQEFPTTVNSSEKKNGRNDGGCLFSVHGSVLVV